MTVARKGLTATVRELYDAVFRGVFPNGDSSALSTALGGGLPAWWTVVSTEDEEQVTIGGHVNISPTDQTDDVQEGLLVIHTTDDLVNQSNLGVVLAALIKPSLWATPGAYDIDADSFLSLHVQGITINTPVEEGGAFIDVKARGVDANARYGNAGATFADAGGIKTQIGPSVIQVTGLPTVDTDLAPGRFWNDGGTIKVSAGS